MFSLGKLFAETGARRIVCMMLTIGLIVGSFSCFVCADEVDDVESDIVFDQSDECVEDEKDTVDVVASDVVIDDAVIEVDEDEQIEADIDNSDEVSDKDENVEEDVSVADAIEAEDEPVEEREVSSVADVAVSATATAPADLSGKKVLIWEVDFDHSDSAWLSERLADVKNIYQNLGAEVVWCSNSTLTESDLSGVDLVFTSALFFSSTSEAGEDFIASAGVLKEFVKNGGHLILNGEYCDWATPGSNTMAILSSKIGFEYSVSGAYSFTNVIYNDSMPEFTKNLADEGFFPTYAASITTSDPGAKWLGKGTNDIVFLMEKEIGDGCIVVITDFNYINLSPKASTSTPYYLANLLMAQTEHSHCFTYEAEDNVIYANCTATCTSKSSVTLVAPTLEYEGEPGNAEATIANLENFNTLTGLAVSADDLIYSGRGDTSYESSSTAPVEPGTYTVSLEVEGETACLDYEIKAIEYSFNSDTTKEFTKDSTVIPKFHASRNVSDNTTKSHLSGVLVDGKAVEEGNLKISDGSVIVEIKNAFINGLSVGDHTITLTFDDAPAISTTLKVKAATQTSPGTGEYSSSAMIYVAVILLAGSVVTGIKVFKKKEC